MNKDIEERLVHAPKPRRELRRDFTGDTLAKALAPRPRWWDVRSLRSAPVIAAVAILLTASSAYATFNWQQVQVFFTGTTHNKTFDTQEFGFRVETCESASGGNTMRFGVAQSAPVTAEQISAIITARCEVAQAKQLFAAQPDWKREPYTFTSGAPRQPVDDIYFVESIFAVDKVEGNQLFTHMAVQDPHGKPLAQTAQDTLAKEVRVYAHGQQVAPGSLRPGDRVTKVLHATEKRVAGKENPVIDVQVAGLVKVDAQPVDTALFAQLFQIMPCQGNPQATCVETPSPALRGQSFHVNEGEGGNFKLRKDIVAGVNGVTGGKEYWAQGRIVIIDADGFTLKAFESDIEFRVNIPASDRKPAVVQAKQFTLELGDAVAVRYLQTENQNHHVIDIPDIQVSGLILTAQEEKL